MALTALDRRMFYRLGKNFGETSAVSTLHEVNDWIAMLTPAETLSAEWEFEEGVRNVPFVSVDLTNRCVPYLRAVRKPV